MLEIERCRCHFCLRRRLIRWSVRYPHAVGTPNISFVFGLCGLGNWKSTILGSKEAITTGQHVGNDKVQQESGRTGHRQLLPALKEGDASLLIHRSEQACFSV
jgi:hypothetical protein